jgi:hypothetical protein
VADIDKEDFYWTVLFIDQFLKDDIGYHWATYNDILTGRKSGTGVCALKYTLRIDKLCVCVCVRAKCPFRLLHTWQLSKELHRTGSPHLLGINGCLYLVFKLTLFHRRGLIAPTAGVYRLPIR